MQWTERPIKVLQARLLDEPLWRYPLLDCCGPDSVLVSQVNTAQHEVLEVAELFTGGFMRWTQGAVLLHHFQAPISIRWGLEIAADCVPIQKTMVPSLKVVDDEETLMALNPTDKNMAMILADINSSWWMRIFQQRPVNVWTVSAPCQPWSVAGREGGLSQEQGRIMLRLIDMAMIFQPRIVLFEQVAGFASHKDYPYILQAWKTAGYAVRWRATLELADIMPCNRNRHLMELILNSPNQAEVPLDRTWTCRRESSLNQVQGVFDLPWDHPSVQIPPAPVLQKYLSPDYMPKPRAAFPGTAAYSRVRDGTQTAGCFLAQYGSAHLLPHDLLTSKGLFGNLLSQGSLTRFFSPSEVASLHCTILPTLSVKNRRLAMRLVGNAIAVPHAAITLLKGCQELGFLLDVTPKQVVLQCMAMRLHNGNASLLPQGNDWVLCRTEDALRVLKDMVCLPELRPPPAIDSLLTPVQISTPVHSVVIWLSPSLPWQRAFQALGFPADMLDCAPVQSGSTILTITLPFTPLLPGSEDERSYVRDLGVMLVCTPNCTAIVPASSTLQLACLAALATEGLNAEDEPRYLARFSGHRISTMHSLPSLLLLLPEDKAPDIFALTAFRAFGSSAQVNVGDSRVTLHIPARHAFDVWRGWPLEHLTSLGWDTVFSPPLPDGMDDLHVVVSPLQGRAHITTPGLVTLLALSGLRSRLQCISESLASEASCLIEVQFVANNIWTGKLPQTFRTELIPTQWQDLACTLHLQSEARLYSGPHPLPQAVTSWELISGDVGPCLIRKTAASSFPSTRATPPGVAKRRL